MKSYQYIYHDVTRKYEARSKRTSYFGHRWKTFQKNQDCKDYKGLE